MFINNLEDELNVSETENGALGYATTKSALIDFNFKISSYRNCDEETIITDFKKAWYEDKELALKLLFYVRDAREGAGERRLFRIAVKEIAEQLDERVFDWIEKYGRLDDLFVFMDTPLENKLLLYIEKKLDDDVKLMKEKEPVSLLAKWMPSINTSSKGTRALANRLWSELGFESPANYRKTLSKLRAYIDVVERKMCANEWGKINYSAVPSVANIKYKDAFMAHDEERRTAYLEDVKNGNAKINSAVNFPHDIVSKYNLVYYDHEYDATLEELWKALPDYVKGNSRILVVRDGSGSMTSRISSSSSVTALDVSTALAIYFSEHQEGQFKDRFITFSARPQLINLSSYETLRDKIIRCLKYDDASNTNLEATFDIVLQTAVNNHLAQEEIPDLLIISDMEFDQATNNYGNPNEKLLETISQKFTLAGYKLPKLIFWNVNSRTNTIPLTQNENGVILVSGFSPAVTKMVLSNELDPYKSMVEILNSERYKEITLK